MQGELVMNTRNNQQGIALLVMVFVLVLATLAYTVGLLNSNNIMNENNKKTALVLAEAKTSLLGYAVLHASKPGTLPCPDTDNNGTANPSGPNCTSYISRLPWKTLGTDKFKDASNECLWYAVSPNFRNPITLAQRATSPLNGATVGSITVVNDNNASIGVNPVVAVIIAPNYPVGGQARSGTPTLYCPGDSLAAKYLDIKGLVNNATGNNSGVNYTFKKGAQSISFNDKLIYITAAEFFPQLRKRITKEIVGKVGMPSGLFKYFQTAATLNTYPCPAKSITGDADCAPPLGNNIPYNDSASLSPLQYTSLGSWLINNGWFPMTAYNYISATHVTVTVTDPFGSYTCDVNMNVVNCA